MITNFIRDRIQHSPLVEVRDEGAGYQMWDDGGVECEVGEFLYGLVRLLKPKDILETGAYHGWSSTYMGLALKENGYGHLDTLEFEPQHIMTTKRLWDDAGITIEATAHQADSRIFTPPHNYDILFLDSEPMLRFDELKRFYPFLNPGGYAFIHDLPRNMCQGNINPDHPDFPSWPFGNLPEEIKNWLKDGDLVKFNFPNPRGMVGLYKPDPRDYHA